MKLFVTIIFLVFNLTISFSQEGMFKDGKILQKKYSDTLYAEIINNSIILKVVIGEKPYKFLLDTGAPTVITTKVPGEFKLIKKEEIIDGSNISERVNYFSIPKIKIGSLNFENITVMQHDSDVYEKLGIDGILGANIMAKSVWDLDLKNNRIIVSNRINKKGLKSAYKTKIILAPTGSPIFFIEHFDILEEPIYFDTGFNDFYSLSHSVFNILKDNNLISKSISGRGEYLDTAFGAIDSTYSKIVLESKIGKFKLSKIIADVDYDEESSIGCSFLKYNRIVIDFKHKKFYITPYDKEMPSSFETFGFKTDIKDNNMTVGFIWFTSLAYKKGIRAHDTILSINGINTINANELQEETILEIDKILEGNENIIVEFNNKGNFIELKKEIFLD